MRRVSLGVAAALAFVVPMLGGCGSSTDAQAKPGTVSVVASTNVYGDVAKRIGGDRVSVTSIITDPEQDPHSYQASTKTQLALSRAKVVIENGGGYDDFVDTMLKAAKNPSVKLINAVKVSGVKAPAGGELNEHVWYDFPGMDKLAQKIAADLGAVDPGHVKTFTANARAFGNDLAGLEKDTAKLKKAHAGEGVAITEPVPGYLLDAAGLRDRTPDEFSEAIEEGDDVPPRALRDTLALFSGSGKVAALVYNEQATGPQTERVQKAAKAGGVPVVPVTETLPSGKTYLSWMRGNVDALGTALDKGGR